MERTRSTGLLLSMMRQRKVDTEVVRKQAMGLRVELEREDDGRWIAEVPELPGVLSYGASRDEAVARVQTLTLRALADRLEHGEEVPALDGVFAVPLS